MFFKDIHGHIGIKDYLISLVEKDRVPHSFLFVGKQGSGSLAMALAYASYIHCQNKADSDSCGLCPACNKSFQRIHPDIHFAMPTYSENNKGIPSRVFLKEWRSILEENPYFSLNDWMRLIEAEKKQANIPKVTLDELRKSFRFKSFEGSKRISIIWYAELLRKEGNMLLKLIEEPPENSIFILIAENLDKVLNTIISRCQIINIPPFRDQDLLEYATKIKQNSSGVSQAVQLANGDIIELNKALNNSNSDLYRQLFDWLRIAYKGDPVEMVKWAEIFARNNKNDQKYFFKYGLSFFEQLYLSFHLGREMLRIADESYEILLKMKSIIDMEKASLILTLFNDNITKTERNANVKLQMMHSSLTLHKIMRANN